VSRDHILLVLASGTGNGLLQLQLDTGAGKLWALVEANDTNTQFGEASGTTVVAASTWYHVAGTYDGTTMRVYVNGVQEGTFTPTLVTPRAGNWATFQAPASMDGSIADVFACVGALSATQVLRLARERFPFDRPCQYWVPYNNGVSSALNFSGIQASLTITGSPTAGPEAGIPWGTAQQRPILRLLAASTAAITGSQIETASLVAAAGALSAEVETGRATAASSALGAQLEAAAASATAAATGAQLETGTVHAGAAGLATQLESAGATGLAAAFAGALKQTASMVAVAASMAQQLESALFTTLTTAAISANQLESASMSTGGIVAAIAAQKQTATMTAVAQFLGQQLESANMSAAGGGGGGVKAHSYNARRPLTILMRRGTRH